MKIDKYRTSKWLKKLDILELSDKERIVTIEAITEEEVGNDNDIKPVVYFKELPKPWPINITGLGEMAAIQGSDDTDDFIGLVVGIYVDPSVSYGGKRVGGIKLRQVKKATVTKKSVDLPFDEIPFGSDDPPIEVYGDADTA